MRTSYRIFWWMWYSFLKKTVRRLRVGGNGVESPSPNLNVHDAVFNFFYIWCQRASQSKSRIWKEAHCIMSTFSFIAEKKLEFSHLFSESSSALKNSWLRTSKAIEILQIYLWGYFSDSNSFRRCLKSQLKMFR